MGVHYDSITSFGIAYYYSEIAHLKSNPKFIQLSKEIESDDIVDIWDEIGLCAISQYYDCGDEHREYILGVNMSEGKFEDDMDEKEAIKEIKKKYKEWKLPYRTPKVINSVDVW